MDTREKILKAAWDLLETTKTGDVRISDIAKAAGISRQALYGHFATRADLLIATVRYLDDVYDVEGRLAKSRAAKTGRERLSAYIEAWGGYIPKIYDIAAALIAMQRQDEDAAAAWNDRMQAVRHGCRAAVKALKADNDLSPDLSEAQAADILWALLSIETWARFTRECGWSQKRYLQTLKAMAVKQLVAL